MTINTMSAARTACMLSNWGLSNLALQKILYLAHMMHMGKTGERLVSEQFQAWDYGPVLPNLYHQAKAFGSRPVGDVFHSANIAAPKSPEYMLLADAVSSLSKLGPGKLVEITHDPRGAWAQVYEAGCPGIVIPDREIFAEFERRGLKK